MTSSQDAQIVMLQLCVGHFEPMRQAESANLITGFGIEGDRHASSNAIRKNRQVLLMDEETLEAFDLERGQIRENITTSGIDLAALPKGQKLSLGDEVVLEITGYCDPCTFIEGIRPGLQEEMVDRRGMLSFVVQGGTIKTGDAIRVLEAAKA